jgi:dynein heavy chain 1
MFVLNSGAPGTIPNHWRRYKVAKSMAVSGWIVDLARRLVQLDHIASLDNLNNVEVWLGGLFFPEAYITATRQAVAHRRKWSLETLHLRLDIERVNDPNSFVVDGPCFILHSRASCLFVSPGLILEGASWASDRLVLNDGDTVRLNPSQLRWVQTDDSTNTRDLVNLPVYLNSDRSDVLFTVDLPFDSAAGSLVATRAVCLSAGG